MNAYLVRFQDPRDIADEDVEPVWADTPQEAIELARRPLGRDDERRSWRTIAVDVTPKPDTCGALRIYRDGATRPTDRYYSPDAPGCAL